MLRLCAAVWPGIASEQEEPVIVLLLLLLPACAPADTVEAKDSNSALEARFRAAETDPAAVVPLVLEASAQVALHGLEQATPTADRLEPFLPRPSSPWRASPGRSGSD